ncbi:MAG: helix-turn-helix transcriptional regulator, partial [Frankiaceae bacterium]
MTAIGGRLPRLLALVPWLLRHPDSHVADVAAHFGISEKQLTGDIQLLWMCGLPGYLPDDLLDFAFEDDRVSVTDPLTLTRPLRLSAEEATALQVAARALAEVGDLAERDALERAIVKLAVAAPAAPTALDLDVALDTPEGQLATLRLAIEAKVAVHLTYFVESRDELTERDVDPVRIISWGGRWYLDAWCRVAAGFRLFRLDRIRAATVLAEPSSVPVRDTGGEPSDGLYRPSPDDVRIVLEL